MLAVATRSDQLIRAMQSLEGAFLIGVEGVTEVFLVRHADCYRLMTDHLDPALSEVGRAQARLLARRLERSRPAAVYSSPYRRAVETASALTDDVRIDERLVEMALEVNDDGSLDLREPAADVVERVRGVVDDVIARHTGQRVVAVTHGAAIMAYLTHVLGIEPGGLRIYPYFTSITVVRALGDRRIVGSVGDVAHLE